MKQYLFVILILMLQFSCKKRELPVPKHQQGPVNKVAIPLTTSYKYQIFFSLNKNAIVQQQLKTTWDIAFQCNGDKIILNSSKMMFAYKTNYENMSDVTDTSGFQQNKKHDTPTGNLDSTAIGDWKGNNKVYIIDRGYNENGQHLGFKKLKTINYSDKIFSFSLSELNSTISHTFQIVQDTNYNFIGFSFDNNQPVIIEPPKTQWDIVFTQYTEHLSQPYLVVGCLLNRYKTYCGMTQSIPFEQINYDFVQNFALSSKINSIGYSWKEYDFNSSAYIVFTNYVYIIKNADNYYFKLRFIDFYNSNGEKGYPTFEFQTL